MKILLLLLLLVSCSTKSVEFIGTPTKVSMRSETSCEVQFILKSDKMNRVTHDESIREGRSCEFFRNAIKREYGTYYYVHIVISATSDLVKIEKINETRY
jgi:hypothetical protein